MYLSDASKAVLCDPGVSAGPQPTGIKAPVICWASSEARKINARPIDSGFTQADGSVSDMLLRFAGVSIVDGRRALMVVPELVFLLNGVIFILIGLQLRAIREELTSADLSTLLWNSVLISAAVIVVRLLWVPLTAYLPRLLIPSFRTHHAPAQPGHLLLEGWTGMRGIVSLAAALALLQTVASGAPFSYRADIIVITFVGFCRRS